MEVKIVKVRADRMMDGRVVYRGKRPKKRVPVDSIIAGTAIVAIIAWVLMMVFMVKTPQAQAVSVNRAQLDGSAEQMARLIIASKEPQVVAEDAEIKTIDEELVEMLALVIYQEAGGDSCSDTTRRMVGEVAMNRVADSRFPDTLEEVLLQKQQYGRLYWTGLVWPDRASKESEAHAVQRAYDTARLVLSSEERLLPEDVIFQAEFRQGTETVAESDGFYFCR